MKAVLIVVLLSCGIVSVRAQEPGSVQEPAVAGVELRGGIRDAVTHEPIDHATVAVRGVNRAAVSAADGEFRITRVPEGTWRVDVSGARLRAGVDQHRIDRSERSHRSVAPAAAGASRGCRRHGHRTTGSGRRCAAEYQPAGSRGTARHARRRARRNPERRAGNPRGESGRHPGSAYLDPRTRRADQFRRQRDPAAGRRHAGNRSDRRDHGSHRHRHRGIRQHRDRQRPDVGAIRRQLERRHQSDHSAGQRNAVGRRPRNLRQLRSGDDASRGLRGDPPVAIFRDGVQARAGRLQAVQLPRRDAIHRPRRPAGLARSIGVGIRATHEERE